jgi:hypothetical protein
LLDRRHAARNLPVRFGGALTALLSRLSALLLSVLLFSSRAAGDHPDASGNLR